MALMPGHDPKNLPAIKPIRYRQAFTPREMLRLTLLKWLIQKGRVTDG